MGKNVIRRAGWLAAAVLLAGAMVTFAASKKGEDQNARSVQGTVFDADDAPVNGAVVQLKNTKTLQIRSFITQKDGSYHFNELSPDIDYELRADYQGQSSSTHTLSSFDTRKDSFLNLKLNPKK